ncbi:MAG: hypothetical protein WDA07_10180 [Leucobacter sp.]
MTRSVVHLAVPRTFPRVSWVLAALFTLITCAGVALSSARAIAVFEEIAETGRPGYLQLSVDTATPLWATLAPGESMRWLVQAALVDAESGSLALELRSSGALPELSGMTAEIAACSGDFDLGAVPPSCSGGVEQVLAPTPLAELPQSGGRFELAELRREDPRQLLVTFRIPEAADGDVIDGAVAHFGLGVHAAGEGSVTPVTPVPVRPVPPQLAITGGDALALGVLAVGLVGLGASALMVRRATTRRFVTPESPSPDAGSAR